MREKTCHGRAVPIALWGALALGAVTVAACRDILKVQDPQSFVSDKLDNPNILAAVANGVEGDFQLTIDDIGVFTGMLSDELTSTSTWIDWADIANGRIRKDWPTGGNFSGTQDALLRARFSAQDAAARFQRVLGAAASTSPLMVQVKTTEAWTDLELAMAYCESPALPGGPAVADVEMFKQAVTKLTAALALAQGSTLKDADKALWVAYIQAGLARANLMLGNYDAALANAQTVPNGFIKNAIFTDNTPGQFNNEAFQGHINWNRSVSLRPIWYPMVDTIAGLMRDPASGQLDKRLPFLIDLTPAQKTRKGVDGITLFYSLNKTPNKGSTIAITKKEEMNLIEAEVYWRKGDFPTAISKMNINRAAASLPGLVNPGTSSGVFDLLLQERFAQLFAEGHRMQDLYRFNLVTVRLGSGRAVKLPMSRNEKVNNKNIGEAGAKCPAVS